MQKLKWTILKHGANFRISRGTTHKAVSESAKHISKKQLHRPLLVADELTS